MIEEHHGSDSNYLKHQPSMDEYEREVFSQLGATTHFSINQLQLFDRKCFDMNHSWNINHVPEQLHNISL